MLEREAVVNVTVVPDPLATTLRSSFSYALFVPIYTTSLALYIVASATVIVVSPASESAVRTP